MKKCLVSGSFDPITKGHIDIIKKAADMCDNVIVGVFNNEEKEYLFDLSARVKLCDLACEEMPNVQVVGDSGMVCDFCKLNDIDFIVRGFRNKVDYEYETQMAKFNFQHSGVITYLLPASEKFDDISSSRARYALCKMFETCKKNNDISDCQMKDIKQQCLQEYTCDNEVFDTKDLKINDLLPEKVWKEIRRIKNAWFYENFKWIRVRN